jgi:TRAP-type C4-dicarboxylate transport system substrate-binding protein
MTGSRLLRTLGAAAAVFGLMAGSAAAAEFEWSFQTSETAGEPQFKIKQGWAAEVGKMTNGRIKIDILPTGAVVPHNQTLDAVGSGILQGHLTDPSYFSGAIRPSRCSATWSVPGATRWNSSSS